MILSVSSHVSSLCRLKGRECILIANTTTIQLYAIQVSWTNKDVLIFQLKKDHTEVKCNCQSYMLITKWDNSAYYWVWRDVIYVFQSFFSDYASSRKIELKVLNYHPELLLIWVIINGHILSCWKPQVLKSMQLERSRRKESILIL